MKIKKMTFCAVLTALICILAPVSFPAGPIPISLATFAVMLVAAVADFKISVTAVCLYILLGAFGLPVFSGFAGGFQKLIGVTGGYIIGYIPCAVIIALLIGKFENKKFVYPLSMVLGVAVCYAAGTAWYVFQTKTAVAAAFATCVIPFIPADCIKIAASSLLGIILRKRFRVAFSKL